MRKNSSLIVGLILLISTLLYSENIDIFDCVDSALEHSNVIKSSKAELDNYRKQRFSNYASFLPSFSAYSSATYDIDENQIGEYGINVSEKLSLLDSRFGYISYYNALVDRKKLELKIEKQDEILTVIDSYFNLLNLKQQLLHYTNTKIQYQQELTYIEELIPIGTRTEFERLSVEIELQNIELAISKLNRLITVGLMELSDKSGISNIRIEDISDISQEIIEDKEIIQQPMDNHLSIMVQSQSQQMSNIEKGISFKKLLPDLYVSGYYSRTKRDYWEDSNQIYDYEGNYISRDTNQEYWEVSLNVSIDFGSWLQNYSSYKIAANNYRREIYNFEDLTQSIRIDKMNKIADVEYYLDEFTINEKRSKLADEKFTLAQERFRSGLINFLDYNNAQTELLESKTSLVESRNSYLKSLALWQAANGDPILGKY